MPIPNLQRQPHNNNNDNHIASPPPPPFPSPELPPIDLLHCTRVFGVTAGCSDGRGYGQRIQQPLTKADLDQSTRLMTALACPRQTNNIHATNDSKHAGAMTASRLPERVQTEEMSANEIEIQPPTCLTNKQPNKHTDCCKCGVCGRVLPVMGCGFSF